MVRHLPGEPVEHEQRCERCQLLLAAYFDMTATLDRSGILFFRPFVEIVHDGAFMGTAGKFHDDVPECRPSEASAV